VFFRVGGRVVPPFVRRENSYALPGTKFDRRGNTGIMRLLEVPGLRGVLFLVALGVIASSGHGQPVVVDDDFSNGALGWSGFFVDHPPGVEEAWQMEAGMRPLPEELGIAGTGFMITGNNHSDD